VKSTQILPPDEEKSQFLLDFCGMEGRIEPVKPYIYKP
jgi:hypothetical protein